MLTLTRRIGEYLTIYTSDGPITIEIRKINGNQVGIGFEAPDDVLIVRSEVDSNLIQPA